MLVKECLTTQLNYGENCARGATLNLETKSASCAGTDVGDGALGKGWGREPGTGAQNEEKCHKKGEKETSLEKSMSITYGARGEENVFATAQI